MARRSNRDDFSAAVIRAVRDRAGGLCSQPQCRRPTVGADASTDGGVTVVGVAAHISAASPGGPRYDSRQTPAERASIGNAIWLCALHASLIDKNEGRNVSTAELRRWKKAAETNSAADLMFASSMKEPPWLRSLVTLHYVNVPRLSMMLPSLGRDGALKLPDGFAPLGYIAPILVTLERAIVSAHLKAIALDDLLPASDETVGSIVSFSARCFTKNGSKPATASFDPAKSPHFYTKLGGSKIVFPYDPKWITTNTARNDFNSGQGRFAGIGIVKNVTQDLSQIVVSPLLVGLPKHPSWGDFEF